MKFCIISHTIHTHHNGQYYAYAPYVREMNLWLHEEDELIIVAPLLKYIQPTAIQIDYRYTNIRFISIPVFNLKSKKAVLFTLLKLPLLIFQIFKGMMLATHIHLRCPGNVALLGCMIQILFPGKGKTAKYAGNWDWNSNQPWSYRLQQRILRNTLITKNMKALVYGNWPDKTNNIVPFFTASYNEKDKIATATRTLDGEINLIYVGALVPHKNPLSSCEVALQLQMSGISARLDIYGEGIERNRIVDFIEENKMAGKIVLHGNQTADDLKRAYMKAHFIVFISRSEGWPKAIAEAMWWACLPLTTAVSCVPEMIGFGERGDLVSGDSNEVVSGIKYYIADWETYNKKCQSAVRWSREFTLERFDSEIKKLLQY